MPAERRTFTAARPVKTERTHEENQERAYIAASRRSDRSLEARIESARRASEIHKKRTGRALRVTEQDVINEEMYEEEDDDLSTQYMRLNAHLHTSSVMFNKKLHDYIATQHGVRNMFMSQYQNSPIPQHGAQFSPPTTAAFSQTNNNNWLNPAMLPPQHLHPASPRQNVTQQSQHFSNNSQQQPGFRQAPYQIPHRANAHQRSLSIQLPQASPSFDPSTQPASATMSTPQDPSLRRLSLPPSAFNNQQSPVTLDAQIRPTLSRSSTAEHFAHQSASPQTTSSTTGGSGHESPHLHYDDDTPLSFAGFSFDSQVLNSNILSMSLPPETQQFVGSALDPNDPRTALFMAGSDNLPQPFTPTYTYNPNVASKSARPLVTDTATPSVASTIKVEHDNTSLTMPASLSEGFFTHEACLTPGNGDYNAFFDFQGAEYTNTNDEQGDGSNFVNWD